MRELSMDELDKVVGGDTEFAAYPFDCPICKHRFYATLDDGYVTDLACDQCGWFYYGKIPRGEADKMFQ